MYPPHSTAAVTRAKNSVVIFDEHAAARAPLYFYLARRGLARVVAKSLMEVGWGRSVTQGAQQTLAAVG